MSLLRVRRDRKKQWIDTKKAGSPRKLIMGLLMVAVAIWYLSTRF